MNTLISIFSEKLRKTISCDFFFAKKWMQNLSFAPTPSLKTIYWYWQMCVPNQDTFEVSKCTKEWCISSISYLTPKNESRSQAYESAHNNADWIGEIKQFRSWLLRSVPEHCMTLKPFSTYTYCLTTRRPCFWKQPNAHVLQGMVYQSIVHLELQVIDLLNERLVCCVVHAGVAPNEGNVC